MSALGFALILAVSFTAGWFCCSYFEQQARTERRRNARIVERAQRDGRAAR